MSDLFDFPTEFPPVPLADAALVLTHLQNEFWHPDGKLYEFTGSRLPHEDTYERIRDLVQTARELAMPIIYHKETFRPGFPELRETRGGYLMGSSRLFDFPGLNMAVRGDWGSETLEEIRPRPGFDEYEVENSRVDPFTTSEFEVLLKNLNRTILILVGLSTNLGIEMTARSATERDYGVVVLSDCVDRMFGEYTEMTLRELLPVFSRVTTSDVVTSELRAQA
jgi:nicotinamidase-related amidase